MLTNATQSLSWRGSRLRPQRWSGFTSTPVPRYSWKSNWEQYPEVFDAIVCSNGWDDVTAALQLLSHLNGDALNVALLVPESRRVVPGFLIKSLSDHYNAPGVWQNTSVSFNGRFGVRRMIRHLLHLRRRRPSRTSLGSCCQRWCYRLRRRSRYLQTGIYSSSN